MTSDKIVRLEELEQRANKLRATGKRIVATNGCFDLLHVGHIRYLNAARELGDALIVGINGDQSVRELKGAGRPVNSERDRAEIVAALECVDLVAIFPELRATKFLELAAPDVYLPPGQFRTRLEPSAEMELAQMLRDAEVELVALAGFMRVLKSPMLQAFPRRIINIHPSLLPKFPGLEAWRQALDSGETITGCTVHYVDDKIDHGDIIAQRNVPILPNDSAERLHARIQIAEHELYPAVIAKLCRENDRRP